MNEFGSKPSRSADFSKILTDRQWKSDYLQDLYSKLTLEERQRISHLLETIVARDNYSAIFASTKSIKNPYPNNPDYFRCDLRGPENACMFQKPQNVELFEADQWVLDLRKHMEREKRLLICVLRQPEIQRASFVVHHKMPGQITNAGKPIAIDACRLAPRYFEMNFDFQVDADPGKEIASHLHSKPSDVFHAIRGLCILNGQPEHAEVDMEKGQIEPNAVLDCTEAYQAHQQQVIQKKVQREAEHARRLAKETTIWGKIKNRLGVS